MIQGQVKENLQHKERVKGVIQSGHLGGFALAHIHCKRFPFISLVRVIGTAVTRDTIIQPRIRAGRITGGAVKAKIS
jgi:hypothetical protein